MAEDKLSLRQALDRRFDALREERSGWLTQWADLATFILPRRGMWLKGATGDRGQRIDIEILNGVAGLALRETVAGLATTLTSPAQAWFRLEPEDPALREYEPVLAWIARAEMLISRAFQASNFYQSVPGIYEDLALFGTAATWAEERFDTVIGFRGMAAGQYVLGNDGDGRAAVCYRVAPLTVETIVKRWGDRASLATRSAYDRGDYDSKRTVRHAVEPMSERWRRQAGVGRFPFVSVYWEEGSDTGDVLSVRGVPGPPLVVRWWRTTSADVWGRSPAMDVLGDVKQLQSEERHRALLAQRMIRPAWQGPALQTQEPDLQPDAYNVVPEGRKIEPLFPVNNFRMDVQLNAIDVLERRIERGLYADLFRQLRSVPGKRMTATEVVELGEEKLAMLGPALVNITTELLGPVVERTFDAIVAAGLMPDPPRELAGQRLGVEYLSVLHQAQRAAKLTTLTRFTSTIAEMAGIWPAVVDKVDADQVADELRIQLGVPIGTARPDEVVKQIRDDRAEREAQQRQMQAADQAASTAKTLGQAKLDGTALGALAEGAA